MGDLTKIIEYIAQGTSLLSILILCWGVVRCCVRFFAVQFKRADRVEKFHELGLAKNQLGMYVLLSLEILIAADIIETILNPDWQDLVRLGTIVAIRTVISYFLSKEMHETLSLENAEDEHESSAPAEVTGSRRTRSGRNGRH